MWSHPKEGIVGLEVDKVDLKAPHCINHLNGDVKGGLPFAKMSAQITTIYVCICILCAESAPNFQLENFSKLYANACIYAAKMQIWKLFLAQKIFLCVSDGLVIKYLLTLYLETMY